MTESTTCDTKSKSYPLAVPSRSIEFINISPAPKSSTCLTHSISDISTRFVPPDFQIVKLPSDSLLASTDTTMHCEPYRFALSLIKEGLIRAIGVSNETCWGVMKLNEIVKNTENLSIASIQNEYSLMCRLFDNDFNELSINENIPLLAYSPLARGLLTGKYIGNNIPKGSRLSRDDKIRKIVNENSDLAVKAYCNLAKKHNQ